MANIDPKEFERLSTLLSVGTITRLEALSRLEGGAPDDIRALRARRDELERENQALRTVLANSERANQAIGRQHDRDMKAWEKLCGGTFHAVDDYIRERGATTALELLEKQNGEIARLLAAGQASERNSSGLVVMVAGLKHELELLQTRFAALPVKGRSATVVCQNDEEEP